MDSRNNNLLERLENDLSRFSKLHLWYKNLTFEGQSYLIFPWKGQQPKNHFNPRVSDPERMHWWLYPADFIDEIPVTGYGKEIVMQNAVTLNCFLRGVEDDGMIRGWCLVKGRTPKLKSILQRRYSHINYTGPELYVRLECHRQIGDATKSAYKIYSAMVRKCTEWLDSLEMDECPTPPTPPISPSMSPAPPSPSISPFLSSVPFSYHMSPVTLEASRNHFNDKECFCFTPVCSTCSSSSSSSSMSPSKRVTRLSLKCSFSPKRNSQTELSPRWKKKSSFSPKLSNRDKEDSPKKKIPLLKFPFRDDSRESSPEESVRSSPMCSPKRKPNSYRDKSISPLKYETEKNRAMTPGAISKPRK